MWWVVDAGRVAEAVDEISNRTINELPNLTKEDMMPKQQETDHRVLEVIVRSPGTVLDEMVLQCQGLTWNQLFVAISYLHREGVLTIYPKERGQYAITFPTLAEASHQAQV
jgi:hypothetical protein